MICPYCGYDNLPGEDQCAECRCDLRDQDIPSPREGIQRSILEDKLESLCMHPPTTVTPDTTLRDVLKLMRQKNVASVVIGTDAPFKGIFTERDFLYKVAGKDVDLDATKVGELMTLNPATVPAEQPIAAALYAMSAIGIRHVPLVKEGKLGEILAVQDILEYLMRIAQEQEEAAAQAAADK